MSVLTGQRAAAPARAGGADVEAVAREATALLAAREIPLARGEPRTLLQRLARFGTGATLPSVPPARRRDAALLKVLYSLWNIVVDDEIDRAGGTHGLDASVAFLAAGAASPRAEGGAAVAVLEEMARLVPGGRIGRTDALGFDLWEVACGFGYEHAINRNPALATPFEYRRYSAMTTSMKVFLDVDCLLGARVPGGCAYRVLRQAYDELTSAVKLSSDVGTLRREVLEEDNLNLLRILAVSSEPPRPGCAPPVERILADALCFRDEVIALARAHQRRAGELFGEVPEVDSRGLQRTVGRLVDLYASGEDPFH